MLKICIGDNPKRALRIFDTSSGTDLTDCLALTGLSLKIDPTTTKTKVHMEMLVESVEIVSDFVEVSVLEIPKHDPSL